MTYLAIKFQMIELQFILTQILIVQPQGILQKLTQRFVDHIFEEELEGIAHKFAHDVLLIFNIFIFVF